MLGERVAPRVAAAAVAVVLIASGTISAQDLEPRAYSPSPLGTNFFGVVLGKSQGGVLFDPALPVTDVEARINLTSLAWATFGLWDGGAGPVAVRTRGAMSKGPREPALGRGWPTRRASLT
jgi:hypothetical protein